jgi:hypothetical protein
LCYPDYPYDWGSIGYYEKNEDGSEGGWAHVTEPQNFDPALMLEKEKAVVEACVKERLEGRQSWVYCTYTDKRDCLERLQRWFAAEGLRVCVMRSTVPPAEREEWIVRNGPKSDVILSHPDLVKTGLDFFDRQGRHNFCTIMFYQCGYNLFTLRQASRRAWRIGQPRECRVKYFYYSGTMQERAMVLMGRKLSAAETLEGRFSAEGLAAMAGEDDNMEVALAKSLVENIKEEESASRSWSKLTQGGGVAVSRFRNASQELSEEEILASLDSCFAELGIAV